MRRRVVIVIVILAIVASLVALGVLGWRALRSHPLFGKLRSPESRIEEVIIRGYGVVPSYLLDAAASTVEEKIGVRTRIEQSLHYFSEQSGFYNRERGQFDGDKVWDFERAFASSNPSKRLVMVVDVDVYTTLQPERLYVLSRASPNVSVTLISAYRLQKLSDESNESAPSELAAERIQKLTLQTLGVSVFLEGFSYARTEDTSCVMYRGRVLSELDMQGDDFCDKNKKKLKDYFVIDGARK